MTHFPPPEPLKNSFEARVFDHKTLPCTFSPFQNDEKSTKDPKSWILDFRPWKQSRSRPSKSRSNFEKRSKFDLFPGSRSWQDLVRVLNYLGPMSRFREISENFRKFLQLQKICVTGAGNPSKFKEIPEISNGISATYYPLFYWSFSSNFKNQRDVE